MAQKNEFLTEELARIPVFGGYTAGATAGGEIDKLLALVEPEQTQAQRGYLDQMSHPAQLQIIKELRALKAAIGTYEAP